MRPALRAFASADTPPLGRTRHPRGISLIELVIGMALIATMAMTTGLAYTTVTKALVQSKNRGIAARLAQDKFETLRGVPYALLMVTPQADLLIAPGVDLTNYPPETFAMGGKSFERSIVVSRAYRDASGNVVVLAPAAAETGLKQIRVQVKFQMGDVPETRTSTALVSDPELTPLNGALYGVIATTAGAGIPNVKVFVTENQNWTTVTTSTGYYELAMDTRAYTITATKPGFFDKVSAPVTPYGWTPLDLQLTARAKGNVSGLLTARPDHLVISALWAGESGGPPGKHRHYVELFNPTTSPVLLHDGVSPKIRLKRVTPGDAVLDLTVTFLGAPPVTIQPERYFLIATDSPTTNGVAADALIAEPQPLANSGEGAIALQDAFGIAIDSVGWARAGQTGPPSGTETAAVTVETTQFGEGALLVRKTSPAAIVDGVGNSFDSRNNSLDLLVVFPIPAGHPRNSATAAAAVRYGVPAASATVSATDGLSAGVSASTAGAYALQGVATGTWSIAAYWTSFSSIASDAVSVAAGQTAALDLLLEKSLGGQGGVAGTVRRSDTLLPLAGILVSAGFASAFTEAGGRYVLSLPSGTYTVTANQGALDYSYNVLSATAAVPAGGLATADFNLGPCGRASGKVTTNGVDPYPNVPVHALANGFEVANAITDSAGNYVLTGIPAGAFTLEPIVDLGSQASTPASYLLSMTQGATLGGNNFTFSSSMGKITGLLTQGGKAITTGVLVIASTTTLVSPPVLDAAYRSGANVLYSTISDSAGNYSLSVVRNSTYTVYGYFTQLLGADTTLTTQRSQADVLVSTPKVVNLAW